MAWITDRPVSWPEWKLHNLRLNLMKLLAGRDCIAINLTLNRNGLVGYPPNGQRLFIHNTTVDINGNEFSLEQVLEANIL